MRDFEAEYDAKYRPVLEALLEPGEQLEGICAASQQQGLFKSRVIVLGITDRRLVVQPLDRRGDPNGAPESIGPGDVASADADGASGGWATPASAVMDRVALKLTIKTRSGRKLKLAMMRGGGRFSGGELQEQGVAALGRWFERADAR